MSFNRLPYDSCAYAKTLQQSTDPLDYNLFKGNMNPVIIVLKVYLMLTLILV